MRPVLPTGTVTFLFTDVEGSTQLWERHPRAMRAAMARHDAALRLAVLAHRGHVVKSTGDGLHAVFIRAENAVAAALAGQRALAAEDWDLPTPLAVRMGLHTGACEERDGDYYGPAVNRASRLMALANGRQVLLSGVTAGLVRGAIADGMRLRDLGDHALRGLPDAERVHQLVAPGLPDGFPPLQGANIPIHNLPSSSNPLIGRNRELTATRALLLEPSVRLLTLTGPGGAGKTRLVLELASTVLELFRDGVFWVPLAALTDPALVPTAVAEVLGVHATGREAVAEVLFERLRPRRSLLVLDNFEHLLPAASFVVSLLAACPDLRILTTSRAALRVSGEHEYPVPPLTLPAPGRPAQAAELGTYESVRLFVERARAVEPGFTLGDDNAAAVAEVCRRLDGLPLAIELAAARTKVLAPSALLERLERRLPLLSGGPHDVPRRQQTLRNTIDWSHDLLGDSERILFRRLAVFAGGWTLEAAEEVCGDAGLDVLGALASLVDQSLLQRDASSEAPRFGMLETIREYAVERLVESGERDALRVGHAGYYDAVAVRAEPYLRGATQEAWLTRIEREHANFREAFRWLHIAEGAQVEQRLFAWAAWRFWILREMRNDLRLPLDAVPVHLEPSGGGPGCSGAILDLSAGGMLIRTDRALLTQTPLRAQAALPPDGEPLEIDLVVLKCRDDEVDGQRLYRNSCRFLEPTEEQRDRVRAYVQSRERQLRRMGVFPI